MAGQNITTYEDMLKEDYGPGYVEDLYQETPILTLLEKESDPVVIDGKEFYVPIHLQRNSGVGARPENGTLPTAGTQVYKKYLLTAVFNYGRIQFSGPLVKQTKTDKGAFAKVAADEMARIKDDMRMDLNWQFIHNGASARATISSGATGTSQSVSSVFASILQENMVVDIYSSDYTTKRGTYTIQSVTLDPSTWNVTAVTLNTSATTTTGDVIVRSGNHGYEISGLDAIVGAGSYGGIDPASYVMWQSPVLANGGTVRPITEDLFQRAVDTAKRAGGGNVKFWFTTPNVRRNFFNQLATTKRTVNQINYEGGFDAIEFAGKQIFVDDMGIPNTMYGIDPNYVKIYETDGMGWIDDDGTILHRNLDDTDGVYATMRWYANLGCTKRNAMVKISDIDES